MGLGLTEAARWCVLPVTLPVFRWDEPGVLAQMKPIARTKPVRRAGAASMLAACCFGIVGSDQAKAAEALLGVELNKLEIYDKGCRAYVVITNAGETAYQSVKLDLVLFQPDGVIARRFAVDLAPLKAVKKTVKLFDIEGLSCDRIASVLVNDVIECKAEAGPVADCLSKMSLSSVASAPLTK
jgi:hypothetical protein